MGKIKLLKPLPSTTVIEVLEDVIEQAKRGEIMSVAISIELRSGEVDTRIGMEDRYRLAALVGAISYSHASLVNEMVANAEESGKEA